MLPASADVPLPVPAQSGIEHIVVLLMENRSFDHFLGWVPGADGRQAGLTYLDDAGVPHATHHLTDFQGLANNDPDHSYNGGRLQFNGGKLDGFRKGRNDDFAIGYYSKADLPTSAQLVSNFTVCDRWFAGIMAPTFPNRLYTHSASTDRIVNNITPASTLPTIWDRLAAAKIFAQYYYTDLPVLALYGGKYGPISRPINEFFLRCIAGNLPAYSYVDPGFIGEDEGTSNDDHPHADIRRGQNLIGRVVKAITQSPAWSSTVLIISYDEWGGFFDHVRPPRFPDDVTTTGNDPAHPDHSQAGFRVPTYIVSPFARRGVVAHTPLEHSAILKFVEWRYSLAPLTKRDNASYNLANILDFRRPNAVPPTITVPPDPQAKTMAAGMNTRVAPPEEHCLELASSPHLRAYGVAPV